MGGMLWGSQDPHKARSALRAARPGCPAHLLAPVPPRVVKRKLRHARRRHARDDLREQPGAEIERIRFLGHLQVLAPRIK